MFKNALSVLTAILVTFSGNLLSADIVINGYSDDLHDRFTNSANFIMNGYDLSGVGQTDGGNTNSNPNGNIAGNWATAISRNVVISANHYRPSGNETIYFYPGNDPSAAPVTRFAIAGVTIPNTDLWLGILNAPLPSNIAHYDYATEALTGPPPAGNNLSIVNAGIYQNLDAFVFGKSPFEHIPNPNDDRWSYNDQAVGRNRISGYSENVPFLGNTDNDTLVFFHDAPADPDFVPYEARLRSGDSGAPFFVDINGELRLLGTNAFLFDGDVASGINYTGNQADFIANYISAAIPEPGSAMLVVSLLGAGCLRRRR